MALFRIELGLRVDVLGIIYYMVRVCMVLYGVDYPGITYLLRGVYRVQTLTEHVSEYTGQAS